MGTINGQTTRVGGLLVEHVAALMVMAMVCTSLVTLQQVHRKTVLPAQLDALAQQVALNLLREHEANGKVSGTTMMAGQQFKAHLVPGKIEVYGHGQTWRYKTRIHVD